MIKLKTKNYIAMLTEKQQLISALSSGGKDQYEYLTGEQILPSHQGKTTEQAQFIYYPLGKPFEKH